MSASVANQSGRTASAGAAGLGDTRRLSSAELLRGQRRILIDHGGACYTLLLTRNGKLILVK